MLSVEYTKYHTNLLDVPSLTVPLAVVQDISEECVFGESVDCDYLGRSGSLSPF